jgi:hypothetical protein
VPERRHGPFDILEDYDFSNVFEHDRRGRPASTEFLLHYNGFHIVPATIVQTYNGHISLHLIQAGEHQYHKAYSRSVPLPSITAVISLPD